jgi:hypothetical protein
VQSALAALSRQGGLAALVDPLDMFDPSSAADAGIVLDRVLWIRGEALSGGRADVLLDRARAEPGAQAGGSISSPTAEAPHEAIRRSRSRRFRLCGYRGQRTACADGIGDCAERRRRVS